MTDGVARVVCRFSCGAASAVATKMAIAKYGDRVVITYGDTGGEHHDNKRMIADCEKWFGKPIIIRKNEKYDDHMDVWESERFIKSQHGASCTGALKRKPWYSFDIPTDILVLGYTAGEEKRAERLRKENFEKIIETPLIDAGLSKSDCLAILERQGIELPVMYQLGFNNNNCIGCCKGGKGYWNKIRDNFPDAFARAARIQREIGPNAAFWEGKNGEPRMMLDDLATTDGNYPTEPEIECSIFCIMAEEDITK